MNENYILQTPGITCSPVNKGRQKEIDLYKATIIFSMIYFHVLEVMFSADWEDLSLARFTPVGQLFIDILDFIGPAGFMFCMGIAFPFSRKKEPVVYIKRGLQMIGMWMVLKLAYAFPLGYMFKDLWGMSWGGFLVYIVLVNDILFFAGVFFVFIGFMEKCKANLYVVTAVATLLFVAGHFLELTEGSIYLHAFLGNFIMTDESAFPLLNWMIIPTLGIAFGKVLRSTENKQKLYGKVGLFGLTGLAVIVVGCLVKGITISQLTEVDIVDAVYDMNFLMLFICAVFIALVLYVDYVVTSHVKSEKFEAAYGYLSNNLTSIYIVQWVAIPWVVALFVPRVEKECSGIVTVLVSILFVILVLVLANLYERVMKWMKAKKQHE